MTGYRQNLMRSSVRLRPDFVRIGQSLKRPGIDTRSWICFARIDTDPDARVWDEQLGWLVDVTFRGGPLDGEGPILCRVAGTTGPEFGAFFPPRENALVVVAVPDGDPNNDCIIFGELSAVDDSMPPSEVNGTPIDEAFASQTQILVFPDQDLDAVYRNYRVTAERMVLGTPDADQPFPRGNDLADTLDALAGNLRAIGTAIAMGSESEGGGIPFANGAATQQALSRAAADLEAARPAYLSTLIFGD